jgi:hypothetical protein
MAETPTTAKQDTSLRAPFPERKALALEASGARYLVATALAATVAAGAAIEVAPGTAILATAIALLFALAARARFRESRRWERGAASEARVRRKVEVLERNGWEFAHGVGWPGHGDMDHVGTAPGRAPRLMVMIETKTSRFNTADLRRTARAATVLAHGRHGPIPTRAVLVTITPRETRLIDGVHVCSVERLVGVLCSLHADHERRSAQRPGAMSARPTNLGADRRRGGAPLRDFTGDKRSARSP